MKKIFTFGCMLLGISSLFAGEFNWSEFQPFYKANDVAGMKKYIETNGTLPSGDKSTINNKYMFILCKLIVKNAVEKNVTPDNVYTIIDQLVGEQSNWSDSEKLAVRTRVYHANAGWLKISKNNDLYKQKMTEIGNKSENVESLKTTHVNKQDVILVARFRSDFERLVPSVAKFDPWITFNLVMSHKFGKQAIVASINSLVEDIAVINDPAKLNRVIFHINKLTNPEYDEQVKTLLVVLNRQCYPKIQINDQWKAAVVQLQLVMKSYGL